jgi:hypothetical protein
MANSATRSLFRRRRLSVGGTSVEKRRCEAGVRIGYTCKRSRFPKTVRHQWRAVFIPWHHRAPVVTNAVVLIRRTKRLEMGQLVNKPNRRITNGREERRAEQNRR